MKPTRTGLAALLLCAVVTGPARGQERGQQATLDPRPASSESGQRRRPPAVRPSAAASRRQPGRPGSLEISAGVSWLGPIALGSRAATMTPNATSGPAFTYFNTSGRMSGAPAFDGRVTYNLTSRFAVEGGFVSSRPDVNLSVSNDFEGTPGFTAAGEKLSQFFADGNLLVFLPGLGFAEGRGRVYLEGGVGYLRQLHAGNYLVETGQVYNIGAGMKYYFKTRPKGPVKAFGLRVDLRTHYETGGYSFDNRKTWQPALGGGLVLAF